MDQRELVTPNQGEVERPRERWKMNAGWLLVALVTLAAIVALAVVWIAI